MVLNILNILKSQADRHKKLMAYAGTSLISKGAGLLTQLVSIPLITSKYSETDLSLWLLISTLYGIFLILDLGLGSLAINKSIDINTTNGKYGVYLLYKKIASVLVSWGVIVVLTFALLTAFGAAIAPDSYQKSMKLFDQYIVLFAILFSLLMTLQSLSNILYGISRGHLIGIYQAMSQIAFLTIFYIGVHKRLEIFDVALLAYSGMAVVLLCLAVYILIILKCPRQPEQVKFNVLKIKEGTPFFIMQITNALAYSLDAIFIAAMIKLEAVPEYLLTQKIFLIISVILSSLLNATWPIYREELNNNKFETIANMYRVKLKYAVLWTVISSALIVVIIGPFFEIWTNGKIQPAISLTFCFAAWTILNAVGGSQAMLMNGLGEIRLQARCTLIAAPINLLLTYIFTKNYGVYGPILASIITVSVLYLFCDYFIKKSLNKMIVMEKIYQRQKIESI